jgi:hypothetical protein
MLPSFPTDLFPSYSAGYDSSDVVSRYRHLSRIVFSHGDVQLEQLQELVSCVNFHS